MDVTNLYLLVSDILVFLLSIRFILSSAMNYAKNL